MKLLFFSLAGLGLGSEVDKQRPVTKVINLLKEMQVQLEEEVIKDKETFDKFKCWCTTNEKEKVESIKAAKERIELLKANIEEYTSTEARLHTEIADLEEEVDKNQKSVDSATAIRRKEVEEMNDEEKDLIKSIRALKSALVALGKHNSLFEQSSLTSIAKLLDHQLMNGVLTSSEKKAVQSFLQAPGGFKSHATQSGQIFGILGAMLDTFEANLSSSQREELEAQRVFETMKKAKSEEITAGQQMVNKKNEELAATRLANAEAQQNLEDTQASLAADEEFLADLRDQCSKMDAEFEARTAARQEEQLSVAEALKILSSDEVHDLFTNTFNPETPTAFVQLTANKRAKVAKMLNAAASKYNNPLLAGLAVQVRLDAFTKVKQAIDEMIAALKKEKEDEIKHKDWCKEEFHQNLNSQESTQRDINEHIAAIDGLDADIKQLDQELVTLKKEIAELHVQLQRASETRKVQNEEFRHVIEEQRATQMVLAKALNVLKDVFHRKEKARFALLQRGDDEPVGPPPPEKFKAYAKNESSNTVITMIQTIIDETKKMEQDITRDERNSQEGYERFAKETSRTTDTKSKSVVNKTEIRATKNQEREELAGALDAHEDQSKKLNDEKGDLHSSCDFVLQNFDARQEARDQESESLRQAKSILSGSSAGAGFLQRF